MNAGIPAIALAVLCLTAAVYFSWLALRAALRVGSYGEATSYRDDDQRHEFLDRKEAILEDIRDLGFEHSAGKLSDADFEASDKALRAEARDILRALDEAISPFRAEAEAMVAGRLGRSSVPAPAPDAEERPPSDPGQEEPAAPALPDRVCPSCTVGNAPDAEVCRKCGARVAPIECASCETVNDADATFCKKCGSSLELPEGSE